MEYLVFLSSTGLYSSNGMVIIGSLIVIISYLFNLVAKRFVVNIVGDRPARGGLNHRTGCPRFDPYS